jgi:hypothetical protein
MVYSVVVYNNIVSGETTGRANPHRLSGRPRSLPQPARKGVCQQDTYRLPRRVFRELEIIEVHDHVVLRESPRLE